MKRALVLLTLFACGCAGASSPSLDAANETLAALTPPSWVEGGDPRAMPATEWWTDFGDPALDAVVAEALAHNHDLAAAAARVAEADAQARIAGADLYPTLSAGSNAMRSKRVFVGFPFPETPDGGTDTGDQVLSTTSNQFGVSLDLSWEIDLWGRLRAARDAARADAAAARIAYEGARLSLAAQSAKTWFALQEARAQVELAEATLASYRTGAEHVSARYERGTRSPLDVRLALTSAEGAAARVAERRSLLERTSRQLEVLLGRYPAGRLAAGGQLDLTAPPVPVGLPSDLLARRPDLASAARKLYAADRRVRSAEAALLPRVSLTGSAGTVSEEIVDVLDGDFGVWSLAANLIQPVFEGGRLRANIALTQGAADRARAEYIALALRAFAEVESALADEGYEADLVRALAAAAEQSRAAETLAAERYAGGLEDYVTVLAAQRAALDAQSALLDARRRRLETRVDLHLAIGGGFTPSNPS